MAEACCLCSADVSVGTMKTKRRKVNGEASKMALDVIDNLAQGCFMRTLSSTLGPDAFFCYQCKKKAEGLVALRQKLQSDENELLSNIGCALGHPRGIILRKRPRDLDHSLEPVWKACRTEEGEELEGGSKESNVTVSFIN